MEFFKPKFLTPRFHTYCGWAAIIKWTKGEMILKVGKGHTGKLGTYHSYGF